MNTFKTFLLMVAMTGLIVLIGNAMGGQEGMIIALGIAAVMNFVGYWFSDKIILRMYRAKPVTEAEEPQLYRMVENLARRASMPMPKLYVIPTDAPNAFATGRNPHHAAVAVTQGLKTMLDPNEIEGVLAHELAHVRNRDILIGSIAATMAGAIMILGRMAMWGAMFSGRGRDRGGGLMILLVMIVGYVAALMIQMAISRSREYLADETGAKLTGQPSGLANALRKLEQGARARPMQAQPETAHMFIVNPLTGGGVGGMLRGAFSTHPPIPKRVERLRAMEGRSLSL